MSDKIIGVVCLGLSAACAVWMRHRDAELFYMWLFGLIGVIQLVIGEKRMRKSDSD